MARLLHLVRHGEVENPNEVVYASLPGFRLSDLGRRQARLAARYLSRQPVVAVWSSPLERALESAAILAARFQLPVSVEAELREWRMADAWAGVRWDDLPHHRPGELEAYLETPTDLAFGAESLSELADRMSHALVRLTAGGGEGDLVVVSHQDPIQAARLALTGRGTEAFHQDKPRHAEVVTLRPGTPWSEVAAWAPPEEEPADPSAEATEELGVGLERELG